MQKFVIGVPLKKFVGYVPLKKLVGTWRAFHFCGISRGPWFFGFVRFEHVRDPKAPALMGDKVGA
jgi:hypothetical protein